VIEFLAKHNIFGTVVIDNEIKGIVTMVRFHPGPGSLDRKCVGVTVDYFVAWWNNGDMHEQWIDEGRLS